MPLMTQVSAMGKERAKRTALRRQAAAIQSGVKLASELAQLGRHSKKKAGKLGFSAPHHLLLTGYRRLYFLP
jgi:hypothetical protein